MKRDLRRQSFILGSVIIAGVVGVGCSCDGGTWETSYYPICTTNEGTVILEAPDRYGLSGTLPVLGYSNLDSMGPGFHAAPQERKDYIFSLEVTVPPMTAPMRYTLPVTASSLDAREPVILAVAMAASDTQDTVLDLVSGLIDVAVSTSEEFRASFEMVFENPTTGERFSLSNGTTEISGCRLQEQRYCQAGD